ncbi:Zinc knuckle [Popillia japonica]|uniref:Zinc knuckle n=1 Tax=Popillia japonica TaxID=7064 RepID=A0AAW1LXY2_POPJA
MKRYQKPSQSQKGRITCYNCNKKGHISRECRAPRRNQGQKSQNSNPSASNSKYGAFHIESEKNVLGGLSDETTWILDSGASAHMTSNKRLFTVLREIDEFRLGNNEKLPVKGIGTINIQCWIRERWIENMITYVWYVPGLHKNLFSEGAVTSKSMQVTKSNDMAEIHHDGQLKACAIRGTNNLYTLLFRITDPEANLTISASLKLWHERMRHINVKTISEMVTSNHQCKFKTMARTDETYQCQNHK